MSFADVRHSMALLRVGWRYRLDLCLPLDHINRSASLTALKFVQRLLPTPTTSNGERLRDALIALGPVYTKFGQLLSTRLDLIDDEVASALADLQDNVGPLTNFSAEEFVSKALGKSWRETFASIDAIPLASASIAQVHTATLLDGREVVIKVVRPSIEQQINADMRFLGTLVSALDRRLPDMKRLHLPQVVEDHHQVLLSELDMFHEARNQIQLRRNFADSDLLYVPKVESELTRANMLVMERIYGLPIREVAELERLEVDLEKLASKGVETFFTQVFRHNFFHADMHPGNIFVDVSDPKNPRYIALDCAIVGTLSEADQAFLAQSLLAFFNRDFAQITRLFIDGGWVPADTDSIAFERVIADVCEPIFEKPLAEISFADFVIVLMRTAQEFEMDMQPQLALLQKTLLYVEGVGRQLYPELDLWQTAKPFMEEWAQERFNPFARFSDWLLREAGAIPKTDPKWQVLAANMARQQRTLARVENQLSNEQRRRSRKRVLGGALVAASIALLWQPLSGMLMTGDASLLAGVTGLLLGSALVIRT